MTGKKRPPGKRDRAYGDADSALQHAVVRGVPKDELDRLRAARDAVKPWREKYLDINTRREPHTDHFCVACQKDMDPAKPYRSVHVVGGGAFVLHPADEGKYVPDNGDMGWFPIGPDCARKLGLEWTTEPKK